MRASILLILSCSSLVAADSNVQVSSSASTNSETGAVLTIETFTRNGQTNLVRTTKSQRGEVVYRSQRFCHKGESVASVTFREGIQSFHTVPGSPYHVDMEFLPSRDVRCLMIQGPDFIDGFYPTNGVYYPAPDSDLEMKPVPQADTTDVPTAATSHVDVAIVSRTLETYQVGKTTFADFKRDVGLVTVERPVPQPPQSYLNPQPTSPNLPNTQKVQAVPGGSPWKIYEVRRDVNVTNWISYQSDKFLVGDINHPISILTFDGQGNLTDISPVSTP